MYYRRAMYLADPVSVINYDFFTYYRNNEKHRNFDNVKRNKDVAKIVKSFWSTVEKHMLENSGGVFLDKFGYFCITMNPRKSVSYGNNKKKYFDSHTRSRNYFITFISSTRDMIFNSFTMDRAFNRNIKTRLVEKLKKGKKYYNFFPELTQILKDRNYIK